MIKVRNFSFKYKKDNILENLNFTIEPNEIYVLLGINGSGKSTLLRCLAGLEKIDKNTILINNKDLNDISIKDRSKLFSYVSQSTNNISEFSVLEYLQFSFVNQYKFFESEKTRNNEKILALLKEVNMDAYINNLVIELSGGQKQIIEICAAILQDTSIIYLDEPTSALDLKNQNMVLKMINELKASGKTIIMSDHNPNHALYLNSKVILLDNKTIKKIDDAKKIIKISELNSIYGNDIKNSKNFDYDEITI
ncbi:ABC transporter ATP-binding protein [Mycoplasma enhydrae]|uniref:ABC transporter ATP-binding protein n=1 Tax=Mycoplasma enhydrae TaxID=2499220 RepID=UPI00197B18EC|nr:ABC transporter ATP-binding protein [Mycoplasma enhydrae]MBN4089674.1 ABC transporter ATP-binding protein [Mycoplasma enhydrae]